MFEQPSGDSHPVLRAMADRSPARSIPELLIDLLKGLANLDAPRAARRAKLAVRRYHDAEFNYIEAAMPGLEGVEADICIHDGRIFVRVAR